MAYIAKTAYAKAVLQKLRSKLVVVETFNQKYDDMGDTIKIPVLDTEVIVGDYDVSTGKAVTQGSNTYKTIVKNIDIALNEQIDGKMASEVSFAMAADRMDSAGYALGLNWEKRAIALLETDGTEATITEPTKDTIYADILAGQLALDNLNVEREGRKLLVSHQTLPLIKRSPEFIKSGDVSQDMLIKGLVGMIDGLPIIATNNFQDAKSRFVIYQPTFCHAAYGFKVEPQLVNLPSPFIGSSAVQGRSTGGLLVSREEAVYTAKIA